MSNQKYETSLQFNPLLSTLQNITETIVTNKNANDVNALYSEGLEIFLQLRSLGRSYFEKNGKEMILPQPSPVYKQLNQYNAEKQFYLGQLNKARRENKEIDSSLSTVAQASDFDIRNIDTELTIRIRLEKELVELKKKLKVLSTTKETEEKKLDEFKSKLKTVSEFSKPLNDYLSLGNTLKFHTQAKPDVAEPERAAYLSHQLPTPLYVLYKSLHQNIVAYQKQRKLSVDIIQQQPDNYFKELNISPLSVIVRIITHRKKEAERVLLTLKFDYLETLDVVIVSTFSQRGGNIQFDDQIQGQKEPHFLNDLIKNDNGEFLPISSKAFILPTLVPLVSELQGKAYNWVQALCGYPMSPSMTLSLDERVNYRPLGQISDYVPDKHRPKPDQGSPKQDTKIDIDDVPVEVVEMDLLDQGDLIMMQDYSGRQEKNEEEAKEQISDAEESDMKNEAIPEEETDMVIDDTKLNELLPKSKNRSDLTGDSSIVLNLIRMIKDHWWRNYS